MPHSWMSYPVTMWLNPANPNTYFVMLLNPVATATGFCYILNMKLNQVLELQITQEEKDMMAELLSSPNAPKIMYFMMRTFAAQSDENLKFVMNTIPELANTAIDRANVSVLKKQKVIESLEVILPPNLKRYPYGNAGVLTYIVSQCNFKELYDPEHAYLALASRYMTGSPAGRIMIQQFKELLDKGEELWKDPAWLCIDLIGYGDECREMIRWCLDNRDKWDDVDSFTPFTMTVDTAKCRKKMSEEENDKT